MIEHSGSASIASESDYSDRAIAPESAVSPSEPSSETLALVSTMVKAADDRKASDITVLNVADVSYIADYFVIVTGLSVAQVRAIARSVKEEVEETLQLTPIRTEGLGDGGWVLLDYGASILHIFMPKEREFYDLEAFWGHAEKVEISSLIGERMPSQ